MPGKSTPAIVNFAYNRRVLVLKDFLLSSVILYAIKELRESTSEEIRRNVRDISGFDIQSDDFFDKILAKLKDDNLIEYHGRLIKCTKGGDDYCEENREKYEHMELSAFNCFMNLLLEHIYEYHSDLNLPELTEEIQRGMKNAFLNSLKHISGVDLNNRLHGRNVAGDCRKYFEIESTLTDETLIDCCSMLCNLFFDQNNRPEEIKDILLVLHYNAIAEYTHQDAGVRNFFTTDISEKRICLDTNALIAAITTRDRYHPYIHFLLTHLKDLGDGKINVFWFQETAEEFDSVFSSSYRLVEALNSYPAANLDRIAESESPSFIKDYIQDRWYNLEVYKKHVLGRYAKLKELCMDTIKEVSDTMDQGDQRELDSIRSEVREYLSSNGTKRGATLEHDATILAKLIYLRTHEIDAHSFRWDDVLGDDMDVLMKILRDDFGVDWAECEGAMIDKSDGDKTVHITRGEHSAKIMIDEEGGKATLQIDDNRVHNLSVKVVDGKREVYMEDLIADYWLVTFDGSMVRYAHRDYKNTGRQPVCIGGLALQSLMDPYLEAGAIVRTGATPFGVVPMNLRRIRRLEDINLQICDSIQDYRKILAGYFDQYNEREFGE